MTLEPRRSVDGRDDEVVRVSLLDIPVPIWERADDEGKDLMREFTLIVLNGDRNADAPSQLLDLIEELERDYGTIGRAQAERFERARSEEEPVIDCLDYDLPRRSARDIVRLADALDAADEYCREGEHLLSLAASPATKAFRDWFLGELVTQLNGGEPTPWPQSRHAAVIRQGVSE